MGMLIPCSKILLGTYTEKGSVVATRSRVVPRNHGKEAVVTLQ